MENQDFVTAPQKYGTANGGYATRNEYGFVENQDFILVLNQQNKVSNKIIENPAPQKNGARKSMTYDNWQGRIEYYVTLDIG